MQRSLGRGKAKIKKGPTENVHCRSFFVGGFTCSYSVASQRTEKAASRAEQIWALLRFTD
jgi:hypothetical protein